MSDETIGLAEAIKTLREDLTKAILEGKGKALQFGLGPIELELNVAVERAKEAGAGIKWMIFSADGKVGKTDTITQKIKLELIPPTGVLVGDDDTPPTS